MTPRDEAVAGAYALGAVLSSQQEIVRAMRTLAEQEQDAIVSGDVTVLTEVVEEQQQLMEHLDALETERMTALVAIAAATGLNAESATISAIAATLPLERATELTRLGQDLRAEAIALQQVQDVNEQLLETSRSLVDRWLQYLRSVLSGSLYTASGGTGSMPGARSLDRSA
ncbi:MAG: flagellar protein FlgN, partial [Chloroflexota bacterium]